MSNSMSTLLLRNLSDVFGENDPARRRAAIDEIFHEDAVFYDQKAVNFVAETRSIVLAVRFLDADRTGPIGVYLRHNVNRIRAKQKDPVQQRICPEN